MYMYIHAHVVMYSSLYVHDINMYVPCSDTYVPFFPILSRWVGFQMVKVLRITRLQSLYELPKRVR